MKLTRKLVSNNRKRGKKKTRVKARLGVFSEWVLIERRERRYSECRNVGKKREKGKTGCMMANDVVDSVNNTGFKITSETPNSFKVGLKQKAMNIST